MKTLSIRVPYVPGLVGTDDDAGNPVGHVLVPLHPGADVERFEDAAAAAEGDYAAALLVRWQAELAARLGQPWIDADGDMRWRALQDAEAARVSIAKSAKHSRTSSNAGKESAKARRAASEAMTGRLDPLLSLAHKALADGGRKAIGWSALNTAARKIAKAQGNDKFLALLDDLTEAHIENWRTAKSR